ncbi:MAG: response regulator [Armatimonadetes bacterium]|nr:response regulator [Armatimonadota bacterium]
MIRVLIADDNPNERKELKYLLLSRSFSVVDAVVTGREAVEKYKETKPDVTILDVTMPGIDACSVIRELQFLDYEAKVMVCGSRGQRSLIVEALGAGASHFILKPYHEDTVVRTVRMCIGS